MPRKNVRVVGGKPLIAWTLEEAKKSTMLDRYIVSTDDEEIAEIVRQYDVEVIDEPYSDGTNPLLERILWLLDELDEDYQALIDIRATNPLKTSHDIDNCVRMLQRTGADVVCGVEKITEHHPSRLKQMLAGNRLAEVWPEPSSGLRQDLYPPVYVRNGSIYACRVSALQEGIHFSGGDIRGYQMPPERSVNVDGELDLLICDALLS